METLAPRVSSVKATNTILQATLPYKINFQLFDATRTISQGAEGFDHTKAIWTFRLELRLKKLNSRLKRKQYITPLLKHQSRKPFPSPPPLSPTIVLIIIYCCYQFFESRLLKSSLFTAY